MIDSRREPADAIAHSPTLPLVVPALGAAPTNRHRRPNQRVIVQLPEIVTGCPVDVSVQATVPFIALTGLPDRMPR